jgi:hypothetical protein
VALIGYHYRYLPGDSALDWLPGMNWAVQHMRAGTFSGTSGSRTSGPDEFGITEGEDIGIVDTSIPVGPGAMLPAQWGSPVGFIPTGAFLPQVGSGSGSAGPGRADTGPGDEEREFPEGSIFAPGEVWGTDNRERDFEDSPSAVPVFIPLDSAEEADALPRQEEEQVAIDFGDILGGAFRGAVGAVYPGMTPGFSGPIYPGFTGPVASPGALPSGYTVNAQGQLCKHRRRRRRRLLTPTDLSDLAALQALVGKGSSSLNMAVAKAVRR